MSHIAAKLKRFLLSHKVDYRLFCHNRICRLQDVTKIHNINPSAFARSVVLKDRKGYVIAVLGLNSQIDFVALKKILKRDLYIVSQQEANRLYRDCEPCSHPPIATPYKLPLIVDVNLLSNKYVYFEPGTHTAVMKLECSDFHYLMASATWGKFGMPAQQDSIEPEREDVKTTHIQKDLSSSSDKIEYSESASQIIDLSLQKQSEPKRLIEILRKDNSIIQVLKKQKLNEIRKTQRIVEKSKTLEHIKGFDTISHVGLSMGANHSLTMVEQGPLGLLSFWSHANLSARMMYLAARKIQDSHMLDPNFCYMGGLFQNFGFLFLASLCRPEFKLLNRWFETDPSSAISALEKRLLGLGGAQQLLECGHACIGYWLMKHWSMPIPVQIMVKHHHDLRYQGAFQNYHALLLVVNHYLRQEHLGEGECLASRSESFMKILGLTSDDLKECFHKSNAKTIQFPDLTVKSLKSAG